jgi:hypothetical protein
VFYKEMELVQEGTALYAGEVPYRVAIYRSPVRYGSGDYEDPPELRDDIKGEWYYISYAPPVEPQRFSAGGGCFGTPQEAKAHVERMTNGTVEWDDST